MNTDKNKKIRTLLNNKFYKPTPHSPNNKEHFKNNDNLLHIHVDENVVSNFEVVCISKRLAAPSLIIFSTHKACVDIKIGK